MMKLSDVYILVYPEKMCGVMKGRVIIGEKCFEGFLEGGDVGKGPPQTGKLTVWGVLFEKNYIRINI